MTELGDNAVWTLDEDQCWNLLARVEVGRLAVVVDGKPQIYPVNFTVDGARVLFRTAPGSKLADLAAHPDVAFEVEEYDETSAASVVVHGVAKRLESQHDIDAAEAREFASWIPTLKYRWVQISPTSITGRRFQRGPEPDRYVASSDDRRGLPGV